MATVVAASRAARVRIRITAGKAPTAAGRIGVKSAVLGSRNRINGVGVDVGFAPVRLQLQLFHFDFASHHVAVGKCENRRTPAIGIQFDAFDFFDRNRDVTEFGFNFEFADFNDLARQLSSCLLYTSPSPRDLSTSRMPSSA